MPQHAVSLNEDYLNQTKKRLLDERGNINVSPQQLDSFIDELLDLQTPSAK